jgi:hypothetical protein
MQIAPDGIVDVVVVVDIFVHPCKQDRYDEDADVGESQTNH